MLTCRMALPHAASLPWLLCSPAIECSAIRIATPFPSVAVPSKVGNRFPLTTNSGAHFRGGSGGSITRIQASKSAEKRGQGEEVLETDDDDEDEDLMDEEERIDWRNKIRQVMDMYPDVEHELSPAEKQERMRRLLADYPLVVDEEDPEWPEDADGRGFNLDQFFNKITIKNAKKDKDDEQDDDKDRDLVWQDDDYIRPIDDITSAEWEDAVLKDISPLVILVHNRYRRPKENEKARSELEKAVHVIWNCGLPSPRCVAVDAVVELDLVSALKVSIYPEIIFAKAGKVLYREKATREADELSKIMAFFYYRAAKPPCLNSLEIKEESLPLTH
uniref:Uncharacterized protein n=1 Tax=Kalanchoe fedtschenkoi TaxID=63787 RepID=A0A7N0ZTZ7_KALFE